MTTDTTSQDETTAKDVPATEVEPATEDRPLYAYGISHDGIHWNGSFELVLNAFLTDLLQEAPTRLVIDVYLDQHSDTLSRVTGLAVGSDATSIIFADGYVVSRTNSDVISVHVAD